MSVERRVTLLEVRLDIGRWSVVAPADAWGRIDLPLARDPRPGGSVHVPASSLAGALRAHLQVVDPATGPDSLAERWLGQPAPVAAEVRTGEVAYRPGRLWLLGVTVAGQEGRPAADGITARGRTAIDDVRGAPLDKSLRTEEFMERGTLTLYAEHAGDADTELLTALGTWTPYVGRGRSGGLGRAHVTDVAAYPLDLGEVTHLTWWLDQRPTWPEARPPVEAIHPEVVSGAGDGPTSTYTWTVREPIHIGITDGPPLTDRPSDRRPSIPDTLTRTLAVGGLALVPGETWKGVFRHRVRMILTACGAGDADREVVVTHLFGGREHGRGRLGFSDSYAEAVTLHEQTHVAIDRFTGGAVDGGLYQLQAIPREQELRLVVVGFARLPPALRALIDHVACDLHDGLIGVGGSVARGYGGVRLTGPRPQPGRVDVAAAVAAARGES